METVSMRVDISVSPEVADLLRSSNQSLDALLREMQQERPDIAQRIEKLIEKLTQPGWTPTF